MVYQKSNKKGFCSAHVLLSVGTLTSVFKDKMLLRNHITGKTMVYLHFFLFDGRIRIQIRFRIRTNNFGSGSYNPVH
jgi:hypothetical protein